MPLFGNRVVVATANYKHIKEKKKDLFDRETRLGRWVSERRERKEKLKELQVSVQYVLWYLQIPKKFLPTFDSAFHAYFVQGIQEIEIHLALLEDRTKFWLAGWEFIL